MTIPYSLDSISFYYIMIFDPYKDRLARDIRNSLSSALVEELTGNTAGLLSTVADEWIAMAPGLKYKTYIESRLALYHRAIDQIRARHVLDIRYQAIYLWNLDLFFEMHELLETLWQKAHEPERSALKGWIQAAGVYIHFKRGKVDAARGLARRAEMYLREGRSYLGFISNLDQLIEALSDPTDVAPKLLADQ
jgi:predicted metal-dependent hydrolase